MPARDNPLSSAGLVADPPAQNGRAHRTRASVAGRVWLAPDVLGATEIKLRRRAHRQALALMIASSFISIMALYGVWRLLHG